MTRRKQIDAVCADQADPALAGLGAMTVGGTDATGRRFGVVCSRFNPALTRGLLVATVTRLREHGAAAGAIEVVRVPGAFELPVALELLAVRGGYDALIGLGAVIHGETEHAHMIHATVCAAFCDIARRHRVPVIDGVVVAKTMQQAEARCLHPAENRGGYAALAAIEMAQVVTALKG